MSLFKIRDYLQRLTDVAEKSKGATLVAVFTGIAVIVFFVYRLYAQTFPFADDLHVIKFMETHGLDAVFNSKGPYEVSYRPITNLIIHFLVSMFHFDMFPYFVTNVLLQSLIATLLFKKSYEVSKNIAVALLISLVFAVSSMGAYGVVQLEGNMELICLLLLMVFVSAVYNMFACGKDKFNSNATIATISFALIIFSHERFVVLIVPLIVSVFFLKGKYKSRVGYIINALLGIVPVIINILVKIFVLKMAFFMGTSQSSMDFNIMRFVGHMFYHGVYMLGFHNADEYLNGIAFANVSYKANFLIGLSIVALAVIVFKYIRECINKSLKDIEVRRSLSITGMLILTTVVMIVSSSGTIRVDQRWAYDPFLIMLTIIAHMFALLNMNYIIKGKLAIKSMLVFCACVVYATATLSYSIYYTRHLEKIWFVEAHFIGNEIYNKLLIPYKDSFEEKHTVFLYETPLIGEVDSQLIKILFKQQNPSLKSIKSLEEIADTTKSTNRPLQLLEYDKNTNSVKPMSNVKQGISEDHWIGKEAMEFVAKTKATKYSVSGFIPKEFSKSKMTVVVNGKSGNVDLVPGEQFYYEADFANTSELALAKITVDKTYNAAKSGTGTDVRDLGVYITETKFR